METPEWWSYISQRNASVQQNGGVQQNATAQTNNFEAFQIGEFIGQGRKVKYCGLADAVIRVHNGRDLGRDLKEYAALAKDLKDDLNGTRPAQWWVTALVSLLLVVVEVMMAFLIAFFTPTFGLGCWSGGLALYGVLSTATWGIHFLFGAPGKGWRFVCSCCNFLALGWLITLTGFVVSISPLYCAQDRLTSLVGGWIQNMLV